MRLRKAAHLELNVLHNSAVTKTKDSSFAGTMTSNAAPFGSGCWVIVVANPFLRISAAKDCGSATAPRSGSLRLSNSIFAHSPWRAMRNHRSIAWSGVPASDASKTKNFSGWNCDDMGSFPDCDLALMGCMSRRFSPADEQFYCGAWNAFMGPNAAAQPAPKALGWSGLLKRSCDAACATPFAHQIQTAKEGQPLHRCRQTKHRPKPCQRQLEQHSESQPPGQHQAPPPPPMTGRQQARTSPTRQRFNEAVNKPQFRAARHAHQRLLATGLSSSRKLKSEGVSRCHCARDGAFWGSV